jgi:glutathione peroxidase
MRRIGTVAALLLVAGTAVAGPSPAGGKPVKQGVHAFKVRANDGRERSLAEYRGRVLLIVNTASRCGFTDQYEDLEKLADRYRARGFEVLAFPANDFMNQEPGTDEQIREFCRVNYGTSFPLFAKVHVKGKDIAPLYAWLTRESAFPGDVGWNFTKFLVGTDGQAIARFDSRTNPLDPKVVAAIEAALPQR